MGSIVLKWLKEYAEVIGLVVMLLGWLYSRYRAFMKMYRLKKNELEQINAELSKLGATKKRFERLQSELDRKGKALEHAEAQHREALKRISEVTCHLEATQEELRRKEKELEQEKAQHQEDLKRISELQRKTETPKKAQAKKKNTSMEIHPISDRDFLKLCKSGDAPKVEEAIMNGANVNAKDNDGWTALFWALYRGHTEVANILRKYGAK